MVVMVVNDDGLNITVVGEQPYKNRDKEGSDSGLGHLLVNTSNKSFY